MKGATARTYQLVAITNCSSPAPRICTMRESSCVCKVQPLYTCLAHSTGKIIKPHVSQDYKLNHCATQRHMTPMLVSAFQVRGHCMTRVLQGQREWLSVKNQTPQPIEEGLLDHHWCFSNPVLNSYVFWSALLPLLLSPLKELSASSQTGQSGCLYWGQATIAETSQNSRQRVKSLESASLTKIWFRKVLFN